MLDMARLNQAASLNYILAGIGCDGGGSGHDFRAFWFVCVVGRDNETVGGRSNRGRSSVVFSATILIVIIAGQAALYHPKVTLSPSNLVMTPPLN